MKQFEEAPFTKDELKEIIHNLRETLGKYEKMDNAAESEELGRKKAERERLKKAERAERRLTDQISVNFPSWVYKELEEEFLPLMKEKVTDHKDKNRFTLSHAFRYLGYFALRYPGHIKGVTFDEIKELYLDDDSR